MEMDRMPTWAMELRFQARERDGAVGKARRSSNAHTMDVEGAIPEQSICIAIS